MAYVSLDWGKLIELYVLCVLGEYYRKLQQHVWTWLFVLYSSIPPCQCSHVWAGLPVNAFLCILPGTQNTSGGQAGVLSESTHARLVRYMEGFGFSNKEAAQAHSRSCKGSLCTVLGAAAGMAVWRL